MTSNGSRFYLESHYQDNGQIQLIIGPMFAGKTTELFRRINRYSNKNCICFKHISDNRYDSNSIVTHDDQSISAISCKKLFDYILRISKYDIIGIDEGQFFPDLTDFCEKMANSGKTVIVAALNGDFKRNPFLNISNLIPLAEEILHLKAICTSCNSFQTSASFTYRKPLSCKESSEDTQIIIGGKDLYLPVCRSCYFCKLKCSNQK